MSVMTDILRHSILAYGCGDAGEGAARITLLAFQTSMAIGTAAARTVRKMSAQVRFFSVFVRVSNVVDEAVSRSTSR